MTNKLKTQNPKLHTSAHHTQTHTGVLGATAPSTTLQPFA